MSIAERAALYSERTGFVSSENEIEDKIARLEVGKKKLSQMPVEQKAQLAEACLEGMYAHAKEWVAAANRAKGIDENSPFRAEEPGAGLMATARYLKLIIASLRDIAKHGVPQLPGEVTTGPDGRLRVQVVPTKGLFDSVAFMGFKAHVWMAPGVNKNNLKDSMARYYQTGQKEESISLVLGAGNVSSIACTDAFSKIFQEGKVVLLKMNPVNEYLGPIFEKAFKPLIDAGFLQVIYGGADVGSFATQHAAIEEVHITGSIYSHETIVWGPPGDERLRRKANNDPVLKKNISSELGNVTPWIMIPGPYSDSELRFQAENFVASIVNNASFNCVASKVLVTWRGWEQRETFLRYVEETLKKLPTRKAYYPGAEDRFRKFAGHEPTAQEPGKLPWTLVKDVDPDAELIYFNEESFVCVTAETALEAANDVEFLQKAVAFANDRLWGTLACTMVVHPSFRKDSAKEAVFQKAIADLRFGTVGINYWSALSYAMMSTPWGGYPIGDLHDPKSGIGWVHNTYMLEQAEKAVLEGPLTLFPKPLWFPTHKNAEAVTWKVLDLYRKPSVFRLIPVLLNAIRG